VRSTATSRMRACLVQGCDAGALLEHVEDISLSVLCLGIKLMSVGAGYCRLMLVETVNLIA
jgi:hypothetical protein